jgi:hypothetical protein
MGGRKRYAKARNRSGKIRLITLILMQLTGIHDFGNGDTVGTGTGVTFIDLLQMNTDFETTLSCSRAEEQREITSGPRLCHRQTGVGADGLLIVLPASSGDSHAYRQLDGSEPRFAETASAASPNTFTSGAT